VWAAACGSAFSWKSTIPEAIIPRLLFWMALHSSYFSVCMCICKICKCGFNHCPYGNLLYHENELSVFDMMRDCKRSWTSKYFDPVYFAYSLVTDNFWYGHLKCSIINETYDWILVYVIHGTDGVVLQNIVVLKSKELKMWWFNSRQIWQHFLRKAMTENGCFSMMTMINHRRRG
jgi:hypothetical protein